jgi:hypothetical protein
LVFSILIGSFLFVSCKEKNEEKPLYGSGIQIDFDSQKWATLEKMDFPYRDQMLDDIITSKMLKPLNRDEIIEILGAPSKEEKNYMYYLIAQSRLGLFPLHTKTLVIELSGDSTENRVLIHK